MDGTRFRSADPAPASHEPELRTLRQILAEAAARGEQVIFLGPAGIMEICPPEMPGRELLRSN